MNPNLDKLIEIESAKLKKKGIGGLALIHIKSSFKNISYKSIEAVRVRKEKTRHFCKFSVVCRACVKEKQINQEFAEKEKEFKGR